MLYSGSPHGGGVALVSMKYSAAAHWCFRAGSHGTSCRIQRMDHTDNVSAPRYSTDVHQSKKNHPILGGKLMFQMSEAHAHHHMTG